MNKAGFNKRIIGFALAMLLPFFIVIMLSGVKALASESTKYGAYQDDVIMEAPPLSKEETARIEELLQSEEEIQYYAYLNLDVAEESLKSVILAARNRIIFRYAWVADGLNGRLLDKDGNAEEVVPQFSELFPEDWDEPILPVTVDPSYYDHPKLS